jgi:ribosomal protein L7/L12
MDAAIVAKIIKLAQLDTYERASLFNQVLAAYPEAVIAIYLASGAEYSEDFAQFGSKFGVNGYTVVADNAAREYLRTDKYVEAIKRIRSETRCGLKEAKDLVDHIRANSHLSPADLVRTTVAHL